MLIAQLLVYDEIFHPVKAVITAIGTGIRIGGTY
jgi:hypothetical protein